MKVFLSFRLYTFFLFPAISPLLSTGQDRPNILWITCEDSNPHLGSYGDSFAITPVLDRFAAESIRYTQAFAYTGACSPSRSCLITGVYPLTLGTHEMRSTMPLPSSVRCFPALLREVGYYTSNNQKEDYQFEAPADTWDESSEQAHWRNRAMGEPFFSVFNFSAVAHCSFSGFLNFVFRTSLANPKARLQDQRLLLHLTHINRLQSNQACKQLAKPRN